jgi:excisionase family DNA binding protein
MEITMSHELLPTKSRPCQPVHTLKQVAEQLQVSTKTIRRWIGDGALVAHRFGRQLRISDADLQAFIRLHREA